MPGPTCPTPSDRRTNALNELRAALTPQPNPVPAEELALLAGLAASDTGQSQVVRHFLFWLAGQDDPTGYRAEGGLELRRLDRGVREAAFIVLSWWSGGTVSDEPLHQVLNGLRAQFSRTTSPPLSSDNELSTKQ